LTSESVGGILDRTINDGHAAGLAAEAAVGRLPREAPDMLTAPGDFRFRGKRKRVRLLPLDLLA
jgi:hypothetical protein